jgi:AcrR family transcriptional regulator
VSILPKSEHTNEKIINTYLKLIHVKKWDKISVKELCNSANIARGTFYLYFNDIYDLMEQIETTLLDDIRHRYALLPKKSYDAFSPELFEDKFDYAPPKPLLIWFEFCKMHKRAMVVLLDPKRGDTYFVKKLKVILIEHINRMMDEDGMPHDWLRSHFIKVFVELHFLSARTWLDSEDENILSVHEIINLLNTMRVGANYLNYKKLTSPDFDMKMNIPEEEQIP